MGPVRGPAVVGVLPVPFELKNVMEAERVGVPEAAVERVAGELRGLRWYRALCGAVAGAAERARARFCAHALYSVHAQAYVAHRGLQLGDFSMACAVGVQGMRVLDDMVCLERLYRNAAEVGMSMSQRLLWVMVGHVLVKPGVVDALRRRDPDVEQ